VKPFHIPIEGESDVEDVRLYHEDLPRLSDADLWEEFFRALQHLTQLRHAQEIDREWTVERIVAVCAELRIRRQRRQRPPGRQRASSETDHEGTDDGDGS
jgi:hypothetical protein